MTIRAVVPMKSLRGGKSRLAPQLGDAQRYQLNRRLLRRTVHACLQAPELAHCLVVSACAETLAFAHSLGAATLVETNAGGLNGALEQAADHHLANGGGALLVVASDLPLIESHALAEVVVAGTAGHSVVIGTDRGATGTNVLLLRDPRGFKFCFGLNSCRAHVEQARALGQASIVHHDIRLAFDLDTIADYRDYRRRCASGSSAGVAPLQPAVPVASPVPSPAAMPVVMPAESTSEMPVQVAAWGVFSVGHG